MARLPMRRPEQGGVQSRSAATAIAERVAAQMQARRHYPQHVLSGNESADAIAKRAARSVQFISESFMAVERRAELIRERLLHSLRFLLRG